MYSLSIYLYLFSLLASTLDLHFSLSLWLKHGSGTTGAPMLSCEQSMHKYLAKLRLRQIRTLFPSHDEMHVLRDPVLTVMIACETLESPFFKYQTQNNKTKLIF